MQVCKAPIGHGGGYVGCGRCLPCRVRKKREWVHRILLEASLNADNSFVTLTYDDDHLPEDHNVSPADFRAFTDLFRYYHGPFRYFGVAEYGDEYGRPHYHLVIFGLPAVDASRELVHKAWKYQGLVQVDALTLERANYIAGYVVKKMTSHDDERLCGRWPEFRRSSLGLGKGMIDEIVSTISRYNIRAENGDVPYMLAHGGKLLPLGKYLRRLARLRLAGVTDEMMVATRGRPLARMRLLEHAKAPAHVTAQLDEDMQEVRAAARADQENPSELFHLTAALAPKAEKVERRHRLFQKRKGKL